MSQSNSPLPDFIIAAQCNLHKKAEANTDLALYVNYLLKGYHIDSSNNVVRGMTPFNKNFSYKKQNSNNNVGQSSSSSLTWQASSPMPLPLLLRRRRLRRIHQHHCQGRQIQIYLM